MSFIEQADSWRSKTHLSGSRLPALVGAVVLILGIAIFAGSHLITATSNEALVIEQALNTDSNDSSASSVEPALQEDTSLESSANTSNTDTSTVGANPNTPAVITVETPSTCFVHVGGCVLAPGVVEVAASSRVSDAIAAAGGFSENAAPDALNLARVVTDGERIIVPSYEEYETSKASFENGGSTSDPNLPGDNPAASINSGSGSLININTASAAELQTLNGVGPSTAEKIIADREASGPFSSIEDLMRVSGIGEKKFAALAPYICVG